MIHFQEIAGEIRPNEYGIGNRLWTEPPIESRHFLLSAVPPLDGMKHRWSVDVSEFSLHVVSLVGAVES